MAELSSIFGSDINVAAQPRDVERQFAGFPGAAGVTAMHLGTRGRSIVVSGRIRTSGATYALARAGCEAAVSAIEAYCSAAAADYTHLGAVYYSLVWGPFRLVPDSAGCVFHWVAGGYVTCRFLMYGRQLK